MIVFKTSEIIYEAYLFLIAHWKETELNFTQAH